MLISDYTIEGKLIATLKPGSYYKVMLKCDECGTETSTSYSNYYQAQLKRNNDGTTYCKKCATIKSGKIRRGTKPAWNKGKSFPQRSGVNAPNWAGGRRKCKDGWILSIYKRGEVKEHRYLMEQNIGRSLERHEEIHHINCDRYDNSLENLCIVHSNEHRKLHSSLESIINQLVKLNIVKFDRVLKKYYVAHDKSHELLEHPEEDNQQPSLMNKNI